MNAPHWLSHKPVITVADYESKDGKYITKPNNEARALSIGRAQYDDTEFSAKVFRQKKHGHWSRQSEELPLHRVLDLAILLVSAVKRTPEDEGSLSNLNEGVFSPEGFEDLKQYLSNPQNDEHLQPRFTELKRLLAL